MIMDILSGNLSEGKVEAPARETKADVPIEKSVQTRVEVDTHVATQISAESVDTKGPSGVFFMFQFTMERLVVNLYGGGSNDVNSFVGLAGICF